MHNNTNDLSFATNQNLSGTLHQSLEKTKRSKDTKKSFTNKQSSFYNEVLPRRKIVTSQPILPEDIKIGFSKGDLSIVNHLIFSSLQSPKVTSLDNDKSSEWDFSRVVYISGSSKYFDSYTVKLKANVQENSIIYRLKCEKNIVETRVKASKSCNLDVEYTEFEEFDDQRMNSYFEKIEPFTHLTSISSAYCLRRYSTVIESLFLRSLQIKIEEEKNILKLSIEKHNPGILEMQWTDEQSNNEYTIKLCHNFFYLFRIFFYNSQHEMVFFIDLWLDEEFFEDNFHLVDKNKIRDFYKEVVNSDAINVHFLDQKPNQIYFRSLKKIKVVTNMLKTFLENFNYLLKNSKSYKDLDFLKYEYASCTAKQNSSEGFDFGFVRINRKDEEVVYNLINDVNKSKSRVSEGKRHVVNFSRIMFHFGVDPSKTIDFDLLYFIDYLYLTISETNQLEDVKDKLDSPVSKGNKGNVNKSVLVGDINLKITEPFFRRIFPGVYYKSPLSLSLVTLSGVVPIGVKVIFLSKIRYACTLS